MLDPLFVTLTLSKIHAAKLTKLCGGIRVIDLLFYKPITYIDRRKSLPNARAGEFTTFIAKVCKHLMHGKIYKIVVESEGKYVTIIFFHYSVKYLYKLFPINSTIVISGKLEVFAQQLQITHPDYVSSDLNQLKKIACIEPIYELSRGISNKNMRNIIASCLEKLPDLPEWIDDKLMKKYDWLCWKDSIIKLHKPNSLAEAERCRKRLAYDELFAHQLALKLMRESKLREKKREFTLSNKYKEQVLSKLPFQLTSDQIRAIDDISEKQRSKYRMINLLQGDVGSGKTVVALFAILNAVENGLQAAFMVPTTILAEQHFHWMREILSCTDIQIELLIGTTSQKEKRLIISNIAHGALNIVIGTHTLFQDKIMFKNLGLAVIDEQQRFGVMQRYRLIKKGDNTDILFITATPIPRTLQQAIYGDIACSILREKPECRSQIKTVAISMTKRFSIIDRLKNAIDQGEKAYWVCPHIEESEKMDVAAAEIRFKMLQTIFSDRVGIMHGRLSQDQKTDVIYSFKRGDISLLVTTTVIEVGVDIPDATIMIIEDAEQFGLSQLHQLRGRVGRGDKLSCCILLYSNNLSKKKLRILCDSDDGFYIAEKDMMLRGSGDIVGTKQSGHMEFKFTNLYKDREFICNQTHNKFCKPLLHMFTYKNKCC